MTTDALLKSVVRDGTREHRTGVLIVGAGPAGLTIANLLGQYGVAAVVIERNAALSDVPKALMIDDEYFRLLDTLGLADEVKPHCVFPVGLKYYSMFGFPVARTGGNYTANRFAARSATWQPALEEALLNNLLRFPRVSIRFEHVLEDFAERADGIHALVLDAAGRHHNITAEYLIGADGARSTVRKILDIDFVGTTLSDQRHLVVDVADDPDGELLGKLILDPRQPSTSLPLAYHGRRYEFKIGPDVDAEAITDDSSVRHLISRFRQAADLKIIRKTVYTFHGRLAERFAKGRAFLIGDAAHAMPPFGSQGMNSGARDANNLAWKLWAVLDGRAGRELLETYDEERRDQAAATVAMSVRQSRLVNTGSYAEALLRDLILVILSVIPPVKRYFAQMKYIPKPFVRSGFVLGEPVKGDHAVIGRVLPQPDVKEAGEEPKLLDKVLGPNFAVLAIDPEPGQPIAGTDHPVWARLRTTFVALHWASPVASANAGFRPIQVVSPHLDHVLQRYRGQLLLVRPDRLVAAIIAPTGLADAASRIDRLVGQPEADAATTFRDL